jgi:hypothetical protein
MDLALQLNLSLPNHPGALARMTDVLRAAEVNILAIYCTNHPKDTTVHIVVDDPETAKITLRDHWTVTAEEVLAVKIKNKPGAIALVARTCAGAGVNITNIFASSLGREAMLYLAVDDIAKARKALK